MPLMPKLEGGRKSTIIWFLAGVAVRFVVGRFKSSLPFYGTSILYAETPQWQKDLGSRVGNDDLILYAIAILLIVFGNRVKAGLRWFGVGFLTMQIATDVFHGSID